jgi:anaerobic selenocysteine-containing dehydrogenase
MSSSLAGASYAEKRGSMINVTGRLQRLNKAVKSPGNARDTWEILRDLIVASAAPTASTALKTSSNASPPKSSPEWPDLCQDRRSRRSGA